MNWKNSLILLNDWIVSEYIILREFIHLSYCVCACVCARAWCSNALYLLVFVSQRLLFAVESGGTVSYLDETLKKALLHIRRLFDKFIVSASLPPLRESLSGLKFLPRLTIGAVRVKSPNSCSGNHIFFRN